MKGERIPGIFLYDIGEFCIRVMESNKSLSFDSV